MAYSAYVLTRLQAARVADYHRIIDGLKSEQSIRSITYQPARQQIREFHSTGDFGLLQAAQREMELKATGATSQFQRTQWTNNLQILRSYMDHFALPCRPLDPSIHGEPSVLRWDRAGSIITGRPHLAVLNRKGKRKFVYLITAKEWTREDKRFMVHVLSEMLQACIPEASPEDLEGLDCRTGAIIKGGRLNHHESRRLDAILHHLRLVGLN